MEDMAKINQRLITTNQTLDMLIAEPSSVDLPSFITDLHTITEALLDLPRGKAPQIPEGIAQRVAKVIVAPPNIRQAGEFQAAADAFKQVLHDLMEAELTRKKPTRVQAVHKSKHGK